MINRIYSIVCDIKKRDPRLGRRGGNLELHKQQRGKIARSWERGKACDPVMIQRRVGLLGTLDQKASQETNADLGTCPAAAVEGSVFIKLPKRGCARYS